MKKPLLAFLCISAGLIQSAYPQQIALNQWRDELTYRNAYSVTASENYVYCAAQIAMYSVNLTDNSIEKISKVNGLSDVKTTLVAYDPAHDLLMVVYANSNIDLIKEGVTTNVSDIERKSIVGDKTIYSIYFHDDYAYLACGFGIVVYDEVKNEIKDTYYIGPNGTQLQVNAVTSDGTDLYAATPSGMYKAALSDPFLADFSRWSLITAADGLNTGNFNDCTTYNNLVLAVKQDSVFQFNGTAWSLYFTRPGVNVQNLDVSDDVLCISLIGSGGSRVDIQYNSGQMDSVYTSQPLQAVVAGGSVWIADLFNGLQKYTNGALEPYYPNGPYSKNVFNMAVNSNTHSVYVAPGGWDASYGFIFNQDGFFTKINGLWQHYGINNTPLLMDTFDIVSVAVNPFNNLTYFGSMWKGIIEYDDKLGVTNQFDENNSTLSGTVGDEKRVKAADIAFDRYGNMWVSNLGATVPICVRKADGTWLELDPPYSFDQNWITTIAFDDYDQVWFIIPRQGILVLNYNGTLDDPSDDRYRLLINAPGQGGLPNLTLNCLAEDKDGSIWVGTEAGVAVFYCPGDELTDYGCDAQQIVVNSGGYNGYLLGTENVRHILVDGANQKWVATDNGLWLFSPDGQQQILHLTVDNSPLFSNFIDALAMDNSTGEVYIGTDNGIIVYRGDATNGSSSSCGPTVFPNPVRETYDGPIAISGVVNDADVKITDANGTLIYKTKALGGQVVWDGKNYSGERAKTGVYLVWAANSDASITCVTKLLIIN